MALEYPRYVHGAQGAHRLVRNEAEKDAALAEGWQMTPILTDAQKAAVRAAQIAAGELVDDAPVEGPKKGKKAAK